MALPPQSRHNCGRGWSAARRYSVWPRRVCAKHILGSLRGWQRLGPVMANHGHHCARHFGSYRAHTEAVCTRARTHTCGSNSWCVSVRARMRGAHCPHAVVVHVWGAGTVRLLSVVERCARTTVLGAVCVCVRRPHMRHRPICPLRGMRDACAGDATECCASGTRFKHGHGLAQSDFACGTAGHNGDHCHVAWGETTHTSLGRVRSWLPVVGCCHN